MIDFVPSTAVTEAWLADLYQKYVLRSKAVGKDGVRQGPFSDNLRVEAALIVRKVLNGTYRFTPFREKLISRGPVRQPRQISIPTIRDRLTLRASLEHLKHAFPEAQNVPPHKHIKDVKSHLASMREHSSFLRMDIKDFYPSIRHDRVREILQASSLNKAIVEVVMRAISTPTGDDVECPQVGVPQGLSISNALANIYMLDFDKIAGEGVFFRRYVDDILVIAPSEKISEYYTKFWKHLHEIGLSSHPLGTLGKTEERRTSEGVQYLGYVISPESVSIRPDSVAKMFTNLSKVITCFRYRSNSQKHIFRLNLKISGCIINGARRGWLMFFSQTDDISQLAFLDTWLSERISQTSAAQEGSIKTFKKSYYEIRYNLATTTYIPNFDKFDFEQKMEVVSILSGKSAAAVSAMSVESVESEFARLIGKEISELEKDVIESVSYR